jgi:hypothetical protein
VVAAVAAVTVCCLEARRAIGMSQSQLPLWVQYAQAFASPVLAIVIGVVGAVLTWQQVKLARVRLQHDLYDRRFAVFQAARKFLVEVMRQNHPSEDQIRAYVVGTADAVFLLNADVAAYLEEIRERGSRLATINKVLQPLPVGDQRSALAREDEDLFDWMMRQPVGLVAKFKPFLALERRVLPWWRRRFR